MNNHIEYVDRPRPGLRLGIILLIFGLISLMFWFIAGQFGPGPREFIRTTLVIYFVGMAIALIWTNIHVDYGWTTDGFAVRQGWRSRLVPLSTIERIEDGYGFGEFGVDGYANRGFRRLVIHVTEGRRVVITPTNPEEFRDEILRRRDAARSDSR